MANSVDPVQKVGSVSLDLGVHCLLRPELKTNRVASKVFKMCLNDNSVDPDKTALDLHYLLRSVCLNIKANTVLKMWLHSLWYDG